MIYQMNSILIFLPSIFDQIDNEEEDPTSSINGTRQVSSAKADQDMADDIFSLFPFPLSISSPPLPGTDATGTSDANQDGVILPGANEICATLSGAAGVQVDHATPVTTTPSPLLFSSSSSSSFDSNTSLLVLPATSLPNFIFPHEEEGGEVLDASTTLFDAEDGEEDERVGLARKAEVIEVEDDKDIEDAHLVEDSELCIANHDEDELLFLCQDSQMLASAAAAASELMLAMEVEADDEEEEEEEEEEDDDIDADVNGPLQDSLTLSSKKTSFSSWPSKDCQSAATSVSVNQRIKSFQQRKQQLQQQQQQRQRRQSLSRRQRRRRRSFTVAKPKIHRHSSLKNAKSPTRGLSAITFQQQQQQQQFLQQPKQPIKLRGQRMVDFEEERGGRKEPVVSTSALPLDHLVGFLLLIFVFLFLFVCL